MNPKETKDRDALFDLLYKTKMLIREAGTMNTILGQSYFAALDKTVNDMADELFDDRRPKIIHKQDLPPRFANTYCSQCGSDFGPGENGFSRCGDHRMMVKSKGLL